MYDTLEITASHRRTEREKRVKDTAIQVLWNTGMIPLDEYLFLQREDYYHCQPSAEILLS